MNYKRIKTDVLVIGGGLTGHMAAYQTSQERPTVLLATGRGASPFISGYNVPVTKEDSVESFIADTLENGHGVGRLDLIRQLCEKSKDTVPFLESIGFTFDKTDGEFNVRWPVGSSHPRVVGQGNTTGAIIVNLLRDQLKKRELMTLEDSVRALRLLEKDGAVCGALCMDMKTKELLCYDTKAVILATGGFSRIYEFSSNSSDIGGDGIAMAYELGVPVINMEFIQFEPAGAVWPPQVAGDGMITTLNNEGAVMLNAQGERFMFKYDDRGERVNKDILGRSIYQEVADGHGTPHGGVWYDCTAVGAERIHEAYEYYYQRYARVGIDITKEPVEVYPTAHTSLGGVVVGKHCDTCVQGLFACGEIIGGLHGASRIGGSAGLETQVFGKLAGEAVLDYLHDGKACTEAADEDWEALIRDAAGTGRSAELSVEQMEQIHKQMEVTLTRNLNVIRNREAMEGAKAELTELLAEVAASGAQTSIDGMYRKLRLQHDLLAAVLLARAALERGESCGCHWRSDAVATPKEPYWIWQQQRADGSEVFRRVPVEN